MYPAATASFTVGYLSATARAADIWLSSAVRSACVSVFCCTIPRVPCSLARTSVLLAFALDPPAPAPTSPGDAGVGAAFSHGDLPVAVPESTCTPLPFTTTCVEPLVVVVLAAGLLVAVGLVARARAPRDDERDEHQQCSAEPDRGHFASTAHVRSPKFHTVCKTASSYDRPAARAWARPRSLRMRRSSRPGSRSRSCGATHATGVGAGRS